MLYVSVQRYFGSKAEQQPGKAANQVEQANGVTRMMQQCTAMLRDRMGDEACTPLQTNTLRYCLYVGLSLPAGLHMASFM